MKLALPTGQRFWWGLAGAVLLAALAAILIPARDWTDSLERTLEDVGLVRGLLIFCAAYVVGTLLLVPAWIFPIAAGAAFGWGWGIVGAIASSTIAALAAFLIGRYVVRGHVERAAKRNETFAAVDKAVRKEPWKVVALLRLSPVLPSGLKSYFLGLTCVKTVEYTVASAAGMLPGLALKVWLGHAGRDAFGGGGPLKWALLALGIAAMVTMALVVSRAARKRLGL
jgi:uncharacterized membrane protein YdjX (TVP38/TMEM64 family)